FAITGVATAYLVVNNLLLVRFFSPISLGAFNWDLMVDAASGIAELRFALLLVLSAFFSAEALSVALRRHSLLDTKLKLLRSVRPRDVAVPLSYVVVISLAGGFLDFTATKMVTDWALALQSSIFLGLSWLSLYHIMLVSAFEIMVLLIVAFSRRNLSDSISLLLLLTFLNFIASGFSLILYRALEGAPILSTITIYLAGSSMTERAFVVFASTLGLLGIFFLNEIRSLFLTIVRRTPQITQKTPLRPHNEDSLPSPP
ncbi:MAG TPA: hypothetical protein VIW22_00415, partial [Nitrososphaerales archaeon]